MTPIPLTIELETLAWSVVLLLVQIVLQAQMSTAELGLKYNVSPRDERRVAGSAFVGRAERALANLLETYPAFVGLALALTITGKSGGFGAAGALIWFWARVVYVPVYLTGIHYLRTVVWAISIIGLVFMVARLLS